MLISVRDKKGKLLVKDILNIDYDMFIRECSPDSGDSGYDVWLNKKYRYSDSFLTEDEAEQKMLELAETRNDLEIELRNF